MAEAVERTEVLWQPGAGLDLVRGYLDGLAPPAVLAGEDVEGTRQARMAFKDGPGHVVHGNFGGLASLRRDDVDEAALEVHVLPFQLE